MPGRHPPRDSCAWRLGTSPYARPPAGLPLSPRRSRKVTDMATQQQPDDAQLVVLQPRHLSGQVLPITAETIILGRNLDARFSLDDPYVSRTHAVIRRAGNQVTIEDLGSTSGTRVNGTPITRASSLRDGDLITLATVQLRYEGTERDSGATFVAMPSPTRATFRCRQCDMTSASSTPA